MVILVLCALLLAREYQAAQERKTLINRILARDLPEVLAFENEAKAKKSGRLTPSEGVEV